jgi:hypothetical protein
MSKVARVVAPGLIAVSGLLLSAGALHAQVGYDPAHSPYRPLVRRTSVLVLGSLIGGSSGQLGIGPSDGRGGSLRFEMKLTGPTDVFGALSWSSLQRMVADPAAVTEPRITGPVKQPLLFADVGLAILLAGDKTWHGVAPYLGGSLGLGWGAGLAQDSSGFRFKNKFVSGPLLGIRFYLGSRISLRTEGRLQFWKLSYPSAYFLPPLSAPDHPPILDPTVTGTSEWTSHPTLLVGLGYSFRF